MYRRNMWTRTRYRWFAGAAARQHENEMKSSNRLHSFGLVIWSIGVTGQAVVGNETQWVCSYTCITVLHSQAPYFQSVRVAKKHMRNTKREVIVRGKMRSKYCHIHNSPSIIHNIGNNWRYNYFLLSHSLSLSFEMRDAWSCSTPAKSIDHLVFFLSHRLSSLSLSRSLCLSGIGLFNSERSLANSNLVGSMPSADMSGASEKKPHAVEHSPINNKNSKYKDYWFAENILASMLHNSMYLKA